MEPAAPQSGREVLDRLRHQLAIVERELDPAAPAQWVRHEETFETAPDGRTVRRISLELTITDRTEEQRARGKDLSTANAYIAAVRGEIDGGNARWFATSTNALPPAVRIKAPDVDESTADPEVVRVYRETFERAANPPR